MKVCIVVLSFNSRDYIKNCLDSLQKNSYKDSEILVVDNSSTDDSVNFITKNYPKIKCLISRNNLGYAGGNNLGIKYALENNFDAVWIVNPDVRVDKNALRELVKLAKTKKDCAAVGSKVYFETGYEFHKDRYSPSQLGKVIWFAGGRMDWDNVYSVHVGLNEVDEGKFDQESEVDFLTGASMLLKSDVLRKIGTFDEKYFLYYEENDLCQRIKKNGYKLWYAPKSLVWHANGQSTGTGSGLVDYYTTRNRMLFGFRWAPNRTKLALVKESLKLLVSGRQWQKRGIWDYYLQNFGKGSYEN